MGKAKLMVVIVLNIIITIAVLGFSFTQTLPSSSENIDKNICDNGYDTLAAPPQPFRVESSPAFLQCPWAKKTSAIRILINVVAFAVLISLSVFLFKGKRYSYIFGIVLLVILGGFGGYSSVIDGLAIKTTKSYCDNNISSFNSVLPSAQCELKYYYGTVALNFGSSLFCLLSAIFALKFRKPIFDGHHHHHHDHHHDHHVEDDEKTPIISSDSI